MNNNIEIKKAMFYLKKGIKISSLIFEYRQCAMDYNMIGAINCLITLEHIKAVCFIPGNSINNNIDSLWIHRACNQIRINLMGIDYERK